MKRLLSIVALVGLSGLGINLAAQTPAQTPSQTPSATDSQSTPSDATNAQQSARAFEGKIQKSGDELVLQESATQTAYKLDNQDKAKQFEGKNVKVMATMDPTTNKLHVVDITPSESKY